jgi:hypothetical protein
VKNLRVVILKKVKGLVSFKNGVIEKFENGDIEKVEKLGGGFEGGYIEKVEKFENGGVEKGERFGDRFGDGDIELEDVSENRCFGSGENGDIQFTSYGGVAFLVEVFLLGVFVLLLHIVESTWCVLVGDMRFYFLQGGKLDSEIEHCLYIVQGCRSNIIVEIFDRNTKFKPGTLNDLSRAGKARKDTLSRNKYSKEKKRENKWENVHSFNGIINDGTENVGENKLAKVMVMIFSQNYRRESSIFQFDKSQCEFNTNMFRE